MPSKLTRISVAALLVGAGLLACAGSPARAAGMPDTGTKNFVPGGDAPAYLVNENLAVAPGSAEQSPRGTAYNEPIGPLSEPASTERSPQTRTVRHARLAGRRTGTHRSAAARIKGRPVRAARTATVRTRTVREEAARRAAAARGDPGSSTRRRRTGEPARPGTLGRGRATSP